MLHSLFSIPVYLYSTTRRLLSCWLEITDEGLPPVVEFPAEAFTVRYSVRAVPREYHISNLGGVSLPDC